MDAEQLRSICITFPAVTEDIKWDNDLCFSVGGKMFCVVSLSNPLKVSFKVNDDEFEETTLRDGFMPAAYLARAKWVSVVDVRKVKPDELTKMIRTSYVLVKEKLTKKARRELGI